MEDKDRVELVIKEKGLLNNVFCDMTGIAPASLSHILSGRSKPTLPILRNIVSTFPDINPVWMFLGEGDMYLDVDANAPNNIDRGSGSSMNNINSSMAAAGSASSDDDFSNINIFSTLTAGGNGENSKMGARVAVPNTNAHSYAGSTQANQMKLSDIVRETISLVQKPQRKIVEVRIFFDDGTYESFSSKS